MEDPWANAWGEPSKSILPDPSLTWASPSLSVSHGDHEDDLSTPSWPKGHTSDWEATDIAADAIWASTSSPFDKISLGEESYADFLSSPSPRDIEEYNTSKPSPPIEQAASHPQFQTAPVHPVSQTSPIPTPLSTSSSEVSDTEQETQSTHGWTPTEARAAPLTTPSIPTTIAPPSLEDSDGFGSFETGRDTRDVDRWSSTKPTFPETPSDSLAWSSAWQEPDSTERASPDRPEDEWVAAKREKERQDRHVSPELLSSILQQVDELWREDEMSPTTEDDIRDVDFESLGLTPIFQKLVPEDLFLPPTVPFSNTFTSKKLSEALKLTRYSSSTKSSPLAMYVASKGSTSWEASIKARPTFAPDDITPVGWKPVETHKEGASPIGDAKKKSGGLFSFFGRKTTAVDSNTNGSISPASTSRISSAKISVSPRPSIDSPRSSTAQSQAVGRSTPVSFVVVTPVTPINPNVDVKPRSEPPLRDPSIDGTQSESATPTAISRFIGRLSGRSTTSPSKESLALSADDLEFLAVVPISNSEITKRADLNNLSTKVEAPSVPATLPPPLPPPPRKPSPLPQSPLLPAQSTQSAANDDILSFFETFDDAKSITPVLMKPAIDVSAPSLVPALTPPPPRISIPVVSGANPFLSSNTFNSDQTWATFEYPSVPTKKKPTAASQATRRTSATMNSSKTSPTPSPSTSKPSTPFSLPPPPLSQSRPVTHGTPSVGSSSLIPPLPTLSPPRTTPVFDLFFVPQPAASLPQSIDTNEEDEFSDFLSSPAVNETHSNSFFIDDFTKPSTQTVSSARPRTNILSKEEFGNIFDPLPPPTPAKPSVTPRPTRSGSLASKPIPSSQSGTGHVRRVSRKADHARTLSLLESAAAKDRWLAPPSPIPEALAPPPNSSTAKSSSFGFLDISELRMQNQQAHAIASLGASYSSPAVASGSSSQGANFRQTYHLPPPPSFKSPMLQPSTATPVTPPRSLPASQPALGNRNGASSGKKSSIGGLSAQDLSFFEGL